MDYNTQRPKLIMSEYGRYVQSMVDHCKTIEDAEERMACARMIISVMGGMAEKSGDSAEFEAKLWNHLAAMANYELDIEYPVEIEKFAAAINAETDEKKRMEMAKLVANHMKRNLSNWNVDAMSDAKVTEDMMAYTDGKVNLDKEDFEYISDGELLSTLISTSVKKKKKK